MANINDAKYAYEIIDTSKKPIYISDVDEAFKAPLSMQYAYTYMPVDCSIVYGGNEYGYRHSGAGAAHYFIAANFWNVLQYFAQDLYFVKRSANNGGRSLAKGAYDAVCDLAKRLNWRADLTNSEAIRLTNSEAIRLYDDALNMWDRIQDLYLSSSPSAVRVKADAAYAEIGARLFSAKLQEPYACEKVVGALGEAICVFPERVRQAALSAAKTAVSGVGTPLKRYIHGAPECYQYLEGVDPSDIETIKEKILTYAKTILRVSADDVWFINF